MTQNKKLVIDYKKERHKRVAVPAVCKECGKKMYSLTTNEGGRVICPKCDKDMNQRS